MVELFLGGAGHLLHLLHRASVACSASIMLSEELEQFCPKKVIINKISQSVSIHLHDFFGATPLCCVIDCR